MAIDPDTLIRVRDDIYYLDSRRINGTNVSGVYLLLGDGITLVETATTLIAPYILDAAAEIGFEDRDIRRAIVTHIHLDHAGGTGWLVNRLPHLEVYVHERGVEHLADPSKLIESAKTVYGGLDRLTAIHGEILPVPGDSLIAVTDADLDVGAGAPLQIFAAPGHASHHVCVFDPRSGCLFSGEALGHNHPEAKLLQPAVAPPGFDLEASRETIARIRRMSPRTVCFSQFGQRDDASFVIEEAERQLETYHDVILARLEAGGSTEQVIEDVADRLLEGALRGSSSEGARHREFMRGMLASIVVGYETYFRRSGRLS
jgi:glyoxylase-like metal-dependent hydrolase (beta-lactamase superfamily II)